MLFNYGDMVGNLKVLDLLRVLRSAIIYKAERTVGKETQTLFLKIANPGTDNEAYLKREAEAARTVTHSKYAHPTLPVWRHHGAVNGQDAHGEITVGDQLRYYYVMDYVDGEFLGDMLLETPQPYHEHVGWFMTLLAEGVISLQKATGRLHLNLNPDVIYLHRNNAGVPLPLLLDMGLLLQPNQVLPASEAQRLQRHLMPAYTPPELINGGMITPALDIYELGLILYEMLAGHPAYPYTLRRTEDIYADILQVRPILQRDDLPAAAQADGKTRRGIESLREIVQRAVVTDHPNRYQDVTEMRRALYALYGEVEDVYRFDFDTFFRNAGRTIALAAVIFFVIFVLVILVSALTRPGPISGVILPF